jgi:hypothetical protein
MLVWHIRNRWVENDRNLAKKEKAKPGRVESTKEIDASISNSW